MRRISLTGRRFGQLTVLQPVRKIGSAHAIWLCRCDCGAEVTARADNLREGLKKSCGLDHKFRKHPARHKKGCREYGIYSGMIQRCTNSANRAWKFYGAKGVKVCERWLESFDNFLDDMGPRPSDKHSIDRIDPFGNYEPGNCRWATIEQQSTNRRNTIKALFRGKMVSVCAFAIEHGIGYNVIRHRLERGWTLEKIAAIAQDGKVPLPPASSRSRPYGKLT